MKLPTLLLIAVLAHPGSVREAADTTKSPPRQPPPSSARAPAPVKQLPKAPAKPVGEPVLKRRRPPE